MDTRKRKIRQYLFSIMGLLFFGILFTVDIFTGKPGTAEFIFSLIGMLLALLLIIFYSFVLIGLLKK